MESVFSSRVVDVYCSEEEEELLEDVVEEVEEEEEEEVEEGGGAEEPQEKAPTETKPGAPVIEAEVEEQK